jgi:methyl-accepting chemotaxis protein
MEALVSSAAKLKEVGAKYAALRDLEKNISASIESVQKNSAVLISASQAWKSESAGAEALVVDASLALKDFVEYTQQESKNIGDEATNISMIAMLVGTLLAIVGGYMLVDTLRKPLQRVTEMMKRLANGEIDLPIDGQNRRDEIGDMIRSVVIFRDNALERVRLEKEADDNRLREAKAQEEQAAERARIEAEQSDALDALSEMLTKIAEGNLQEAMREDLAEDYAAMASTFNDAVETLRQTLVEVRHTSEEINAGTGNLASSADDLARRTERQAASLEESVRALGELNDMVQASAKNAHKTSEFVEEANAHANRSGEVVARAVEAMDQINESSEKINMIVGVIDEIAFQTNLLALNAGVEAARAGEAGRGFGVVAQEVRELSIRSGNAAKEIRELIAASSEQVSAGVSLVQETGDALSVIHEHFASIRDLVSTISKSATDQSTGLNELNDTVRGVEHITQANAAMVEENTAEIHGLRSQVEVLSQKIDRFKVRDRMEANPERLSA